MSFDDHYLSSENLGAGPQRENSNFSCPRCNKKIWKNDLFEVGCRFCQTLEEFQMAEYEPDEEEGEYEERKFAEEVLNFCKKQGKKGIIKNGNVWVNGKDCGEAILVASTKINIMEA